MDEENTPVQFVTFDISAAIQETADSFEDYALSCGHELNIYVQPNMSYCGDEYAVRQLASILIDNAVKYALPGSTIDFSLTGEKKGIIMRTVNGCAEMDKDSVGKLFDRFYRADMARTAGTRGFGIGLSIAKGIVQSHHGTIHAEYGNGKIEFTAVLK
jgi:signal transduction histidine kinase